MLDVQGRRVDDVAMFVVTLRYQQLQRVLPSHNLCTRRCRIVSKRTLLLLLLVACRCGCQ
jgi:hypothetical protein